MTDLELQTEGTMNYLDSLLGAMTDFEFLCAWYAAALLMWTLSMLIQARRRR